VISSGQLRGEFERADSRAARTPASAVASMMMSSASGCTNTDTDRHVHPDTDGDRTPSPRREVTKPVHDGEAPGVLRELVTATNTPAISAYVLDSDLADVEALTPNGQRWRTYLHPDVAQRYGAPSLSQTPEEGLRAALEWSRQAGLTPDADALRQALAAHHVEAEDTFDELIGALGVPTR
jgi:hypothetical protein